MSEMQKVSEVFKSNLIGSVSHQRYNRAIRAKELGPKWAGYH